MAMLKCLSCGDVEGHFSALLSRLDAVQKKAGPFEMLLATGSFFNPDNEHGAASQEDLQVWTDMIQGKRTPPMPIYLLGPNSAAEVPHYKDLSGYEFCENVMYLGPYGCLTTAEGLKVVYFSGGVEGAVATKKDFQFTYEQLKSLEVKTQCGTSTFPGVDILFTSQWPHGVTNKAPNARGLEEGAGSKVLSKLAVMLRPRYHFAGKHGIHYERPPYRNHRVAMEAQRHVTRFIALAKVGNPDKKKWIYAFNIKPMKQVARSDLVVQPLDATDMPYNQEELNSLDGTPVRHNQYFYDMNAPMHGDKQRRGKRGGHQDRGYDQSKRPRQTGPCWFCFSSEEVEKHLIVSIGDHCYLALPKGGLTDDHILILPIAHHASQLELPSDVEDEMRKFKNALKKCFKKEDKSVFFFERNYKSQHLQLQAIPIARNIAQNAKSVLYDVAESQNIEMLEVPEHANLTQMVPAGAPYFYVELPGSGKDQKKERLYCRVRSGFPINFGREVVAAPGLLNVEERIDWRDCKASKEEEAQLTKQFRKLFEPFDFTLQDD